MPMNIDDVLTLLRNGFTVRLIAQRYGVSTQAVYQTLKRKGYNPDGSVAT